MPSFIVHSVAGQILQNELNLTTEEKNKFFIGNILPDSRMIEIDNNWDEIERRKNIQLEKRKTHFRDEYTGALEYPNIEYFLSLYKEECKNNIISLGYLFHLYTDYYYFKYFLPETVTFLDKNKEPSTSKETTEYVKVNKTNNILEDKDFWSKTKDIGLYQEYTRLNKYLIKRYNFNCNTDEYLYFLSNNEFKTNIKEIDSNNGKQVIEKLAKLLKDTNECTDSTLQIFEPKEVDNFITEVVESFKKEYSNIIENYK